MIYFDNAATTYPKPKCVQSTVLKALTEYGGNPGRSAFPMALKTAEAVYAAREAVSTFFHAKGPDRVVFTENATHALNLAIKGSIPAGSRVLISDHEHNAVYRPLYALTKEKGVIIDTFKAGGDVRKNIENTLKSDTYAIVSTLRSNVSGVDVPLKALSEIAKKHGVFLIVDASQAAGHEPIDLSQTPCDILCAPGHKGLFSVAGCGFLIAEGDRAIQTVIEGGSGSEPASPEMPKALPERLEAGTLPIPAILSLSSGISFIESVGVQVIRDRLERLTSTALEKLSMLDHVKYLVGNGGILSFCVEGLSPSDVAYRLGNEDICVRSGLHCAPLAHKAEGTFPLGTVRVSFSIFNKETEIDRLAHAVKEMK